MPFEEKVTWVYAVVAVVVPVAYFAAVLPQLQATPATQIAWQRPMLFAIGASILLTIVGSILTGIGTGIAAEIRERGSAGDIGRTDERDKDISRRGELIGYYVSSVGVIGALILTMLEYPYFWIGNALYLGFVAAALVSSAVKLMAYRRGF